MALCKHKSYQIPLLLSTTLCNFSSSSLWPMDSTSIFQFLEGKTILITGATGFLAKLFLEKVLRIQPKVKKLYLLVRATDAKCATKRLFDEVIQKDLFKVLRSTWGENLHSFIHERVVAVPSDICCENLGVKDFDIEEIWKETDIIVNSAATTNFYERYDVALEINTMGTQNVIKFAEKCINIKMLLHVSTAYVSGERSGLLGENPFEYGETLEGTCKLDINEEKKLADTTLKELKACDANEKTITSTMKDLGIKRARLYGWPNTYVFTKAMGEMFLGFSKTNLPIVVIRPTIITSTYKEPFPGWVEGLRTMDAPVVAFGKGKLKCLFANPDAVLDLIPADMVVNVMIMAMVTNAIRSSEMIIYHVGSSMRNPIKISDIHKFSINYFTKSPLIDKFGKPIKISQGMVLNSWTLFSNYMAIRYVIPLKGLKLLNWILCEYYKDICVDFDRKIKLVMNFIELFKPYMFFDAVFDDTNLEKLRMMGSHNAAEMDALYFDSKCINWEDYIMNTHIPGLVKYVIR